MGAIGSLNPGQLKGLQRTGGVMVQAVVEFLRKRDYDFIKKLGEGACGETVLLYDNTIDEKFVCKKYKPLSEDLTETLFSSFVREIRLLYQVHHVNVVRIFNHYIYPEIRAGYILMEYVDGSDVEDYLHSKPEKINEIFLQVVGGFKHLESKNVLHRDIRSANIMVTSSDIVKIIDLGFGKKIETPGDFDKSISLNWWCDLPDEFGDGVYDFKTEVYFIGKLFEKIISEESIECFEYRNVLNRMCRREPGSRIDSFFDIEKEVNSNKFAEADFSEQEVGFYREFADELEQHITKIENGSKYVSDVEQVLNKLEDAYRRFVLEEVVPNAALVLRCFVEGTYYYRKMGFRVSAVRNFLQLIKTSTNEKRKIILANIHTRLDSLQRYDANHTDDDVPF